MPAINYSKTIHQLFIIIQPLSCVGVCVLFIYSFEKWFAAGSFHTYSLFFFQFCKRKKWLDLSFHTVKMAFIIAVCACESGTSNWVTIYFSINNFFYTAAMHVGLSPPPGVRGNEIENRGNKLAIWFAGGQVKIDTKILWFDCWLCHRNLFKSRRLCDARAIWQSINRMRICFVPFNNSTSSIRTQKCLRCLVFWIWKFTWIGLVAFCICPMPIYGIAIGHMCYTYSYNLQHTRYTCFQTNICHISGSTYNATPSPRIYNSNIWNQIDVIYMRYCDTSTKRLYTQTTDTCWMNADKKRE